MKSYKVEVTLPKLTMVGPGNITKKKIKEQIRSIMFASSDLFIKQAKIKRIKQGDENGSNKQCSR